jgi:metal-responsive CopG/Arc/MetJ family transcriptional regulator
MRTAKNVSITLPSSMLADAERIAKREGRTKSELFREALRRYVEQQEWTAIDTFGRRQAKALNVKPQDVSRIIHDWRRQQRTKGNVKKAS